MALVATLGDSRTRLRQVLSSVSSGLAKKQEACAIEKALFDKVNSVSNHLMFPEQLYTAIGSLLVLYVAEQNDNNNNNNSNAQQQHHALEHLDRLFRSLVHKQCVDISPGPEEPQPEARTSSELMEDIFGTLPEAKGATTTCRCGSTSVFYYQKQTSHEDPTTFYVCQSCNHKWSNR